MRICFSFVLTGCMMRWFVTSTKFHLALPLLTWFAKHRLYLLENGGNDIRNFAFKLELSYTGRPGRPTYLISTEKIEFRIDMRFSSSEIASLFGISDSTVKRRIRESELYVRRRYSDVSDESLDDLVRQLMVDFPNPLQEDDRPLVECWSSNSTEANSGMYEKGLS